MQIFSQVIFPLFGMLMILFAIGAFFFKYGANLKDKIQKLELFGIKLEISIITAIILGGMVFCGVGFYLNERSYRGQYLDETEKVKKKEKEIENLTVQTQKLNDFLESYKTQSVSYDFILDNLDDNTAPLPAHMFTCVFYKNRRDITDSVTYQVKTGVNGYKVTFNNLSLQQMMDWAPVVYLVNKKTKQRWVSNSFNPLSPTLSLYPEE